MSTHEMSLSWQRGSDDFDYETYSRDHVWEFGDGLQVEASAAPQYKGSDGRVDPEQALVAAVASCHMLTFLAIAARKGYTVDAYDDHPVGELARNDQGRLAITKVTLRPRIVFGGQQVPDAHALAALHDRAHRGCFIANSVRCEIAIEPPAE